MTERLGVGIIGCGQVAQAIHLPTLCSLPELFEVVRLADAAPSVAQSLAERLGGRHSGRWQDVIEDRDVDVVVVATPDAYHPLHAVAACRARKRAVLVEKPLALTPGEARAVARASEETGVPVVVGTMHCYDPAFAAARSYMEGKPDVLRMELLLGPNELFRDDATQLLTGVPATDDGEGPLGYLAAALQFGGIVAPLNLLLVSGMLLGLSIHDLAPLRLVMGEPASVERVTLLPQAGYEVVLDYGGPKAVLFVYPHDMKYVDWRWRWVRAERQVEIRFPQSWGMSSDSSCTIREMCEGRLVEKTIVGPNETGFREEWRHMHRVVTGGEPPLTPASAAAADISLIERIIATAANRPEKARDAARVVFFGAGWATAMHGAVLGGLPGARVSVVSSRTAESAERRAWRYDCAHATFDRIGEVLSRSDVDVALIAGPPSLHAEHALAALKQGKHVIVEKPLCTTLAEADELVAIGKSAPGRAAYAENYAFIGLLQEAARIVSSGRLGQTKSLRVYTLNPRPSYGSFLRPEWGGGTLFDLGAHTVYWAQMLVGFLPVESVAAGLESAADGEGDDYADALLTFAGGLTARVEVSWREPSSRCGAVATGSEATLEVALEPRSSLTIQKGDSVQALDWYSPLRSAASEVADRNSYVQGMQGFLEVFTGYVQQTQAFLGAFRSGVDPSPSLEDGRRVLEIMLAAYTSAGRGGSPVSLPFDGPRDRTPYQLWREVR